MCIFVKTRVKKIDIVYMSWFLVEHGMTKYKFVYEMKMDNKIDQINTEEASIFQNLVHN